MAGSGLTIVDSEPRWASLLASSLLALYPHQECFVQSVKFLLTDLILWCYLVLTMQAKTYRLYNPTIVRMKDRMINGLNSLRILISIPRSYPGCRRRKWLLRLQGGPYFKNDNGKNICVLSAVANIMGGTHKKVSKVWSTVRRLLWILLIRSP